jgi:hypothetical protein
MEKLLANISFPYTRTKVLRIAGFGVLAISDKNAEKPILRS